MNNLEKDQILSTEAQNEPQEVVSEEVKVEAPAEEPAAVEAPVANEEPAAEEPAPAEEPVTEEPAAEQPASEDAERTVWFTRPSMSTSAMLTAEVMRLSASRRLNLRACWSAAGVFLCFAGGKATLSGYSRRATLPAG